RSGGASTTVGLTRLEEAAVAQANPNPAREPIGKARGRIHSVPDTGGQRQSTLVAYPVLRVGIEPDAAIDQSGGHRVGQAELGVVPVPRSQLVLAWLADDGN